MSDKQITLYGSVLQHGKSNDRIYLMKYHSARREALWKEMSALAEREDYSKIFIKVPESEEDFFRVRGFLREAVIPGFFGEFDGILMGKYLKEERKAIPAEKESLLKDVLEKAIPDKASQMNKSDESCTIKQLEPVHIREMAEIYRQVFKSYPFPIDDPKYLRETMESHVAYFGYFRQNKLAGISSAEMDRVTGTVEMTDFAVPPENRGKQIALKLLKEMEVYVKQEGLRVAYTIARAESYGMNKTFARAGYTYGGSLWNNTQISGSIESMNVWHKKLNQI